MKLCSQHLCEEQGLKGPRQRMRTVSGVLQTRAPCCQSPSHWFLDSLLLRCSGVRSCSPLGKYAEVTICFRYLCPESLPGPEKGKPSLAACSHTARLHWLWGASLPLRACRSRGASGCRLLKSHGGPTLLPQSPPTGTCGSGWRFALSACLRPTSHPPRLLTSAVFTVTHRSWLLHTESWAAPRRAHAPLHRNHGISPARCLWQLQCHRKVRTGETRRECKGGSAGPAYAAGGPLPGGQDSSCLHKQDPDTSGSVSAAGYSQRVFPWILLGARLPEDSPTPAFLPGGFPRSLLGQTWGQEALHLKEGLSDTSPDEGLLEDLAVEDKAVEQLAEGLLSHYLPDLQRSKQALQELTQNQVVLLDTLEQEISKFKECHSMLDINALFTEAKHYHAKLVNIRKEMLMLHEKTSKLKKRALKLQQKRQKEELEREQQREKEFEREKQLTAKPAKRT
ncbi:biogenesis of lysosome-related organelles complex 1 subunit 6 isoform X1 [Panthera uncia]|uniref:biogenesis of lysosome-related organelles complex 1 subunit 6 isoform X1 n=1 Tax=Panthera uncia TaxID=29064 RepID=UPI0020FFD34B|nr:biogenesis of lysosome-related organelles complex 1 subunit 6 isoform X1 [Panthera uncia]